jgi:hypothetical protein
MAVPKVFGKKPQVKPFTEGGGDDFAIRDHVGATVLVTVKGIQEGIKTKFGEKDAASLDVVVLSSGEEPKVFSGALVFSGAVVGQVRKYETGDLFVAEVGTFPTDYGNDGYRFEAPSPEAQALADEYLASQS